MRLYAALFAIGLVVYGIFAWSRIGRQSQAPHFVYQADAWLHGSIEVAPPLPADDWAVIETVELTDGTLAEGRRMVTRKMFRTVGGTEIPSCLPAHQPKVVTCSSPDSQVTKSRG